MKTAQSARAIQPGPGARCLYLGSREHKRVPCTAEALVVTNASAQTLRYPVARVARVVSSADVVDWSGPAPVSYTHLATRPAPGPEQSPRPHRLAASRLA